MQKIVDGLHIQHMNFYFAGQEKPFFNNVSLDFVQGRIHFIEGKNGSGKSTFLRIIRGIIDSQEKLNGSVMLDNTMYMLDSIAGHYAYVSQVKMVVQKVDSMLVDVFTVQENLQLSNLPRRPFLRRLPPYIAIGNLLKHASINADQYVHRLSGGQRQILAIIMMLQKNTKLLLLDEPTAALDSKNAHMVMQCLQKLALDFHLTIIIISHDKELIATYATKDYINIHVDENNNRFINRISV